jgi:hypothetical protein
MRTIILLLTACLTAGCYASRPPSTEATIVDAQPEGSVQVGVLVLGTCNREELTWGAQKRGATYIVITRFLGACHAAFYADK